MPGNTVRVPHSLGTEALQFRRGAFVRHSLWDFSVSGVDSTSHSHFTCSFTLGHSRALALGNSPISTFLPCRGSTLGMLEARNGSPGAREHSKTLSQTLRNEMETKQETPSHKPTSCCTSLCWLMFLFRLSCFRVPPLWLLKALSLFGLVAKSFLRECGFYCGTRRYDCL